MIDDIVVQPGERPAGKGAIDGSQPDFVAKRPVLDDELVLWRAPGMYAGLDRERARIGQLPAVATDRVLGQFGRSQVAELLAASSGTLLHETASGRRNCARSRDVGLGFGLQRTHAFCLKS